MAEEAEAPSGTESSSSGVDPVAMALAMHGASREKADAFLDDQRAHLHEQFRHLREQLRLGIWEKRLGVLLRIATAFTGLAIAAGLGFLIWNAAHSDELIVDSFSVPPDLATKGITGEELAGEVVDRLTDLQAQTESVRAPQSYANNLGDGIKLEIPETGISLSELDRFLREKLGHNTHIGGALIRTSSGVKLTVRAGAAGSDSIPGTENELDALVQHAAEAAYKRTQPYRYGIYLRRARRNDEAVAVFQSLTKSASAQERAWAYIGLGTNDAYILPGEALRYFARVAEFDPTNTLAFGGSRGRNEFTLGHVEQEVVLTRKALVVLSGAEHGQIRSDGVADERAVFQAVIDVDMGAYHDATLATARAAQSGATGFQAGAQAGEHDLDAARATLADAPPPLTYVNGLSASNGQVAILIDMDAQDWGAAVAKAAKLEPLLAGYRGYRSRYHLESEPYVALAEAHLGRFAEAEARVRDLPGDCDQCLRVRAQIAELQGQHARADWWFDRAVKSNPSIPFAYTDWGQALMLRGDFNGAIAQFKLANQKGPHFADPLEMWGEVLIAQNRSDLAIGKFTEANKYAPNWGRLHLKWGEALSWLGKSADAQKQFALAATLDLTAAEKVQLVRVKQ